MCAPDWRCSGTGRASGRATRSGTVAPVAAHQVVAPSRLVHAGTNLSQHRVIDQKVRRISRHRSRAPEPGRPWSRITRPEAMPSRKLGPGREGVVGEGGVVTPLAELALERRPTLLTGADDEYLHRASQPPGTSPPCLEDRSRGGDTTARVSRIWLSGGGVVPTSAACCPGVCGACPRPLPWSCPRPLCCRWPSLRARLQRGAGRCR